MMQFSDRKIIVTGASSGIGKATVYYLANRGASVIGIDLDEAKLNEVSQDLCQKGYIFKGIAKNLLDKDLELAFKKAVSDGKKLSGLVHCAGISSIVPLRSLSKERLNKVMDINFYSFVDLVRLFSKNKYSEGGSVIGISSLAAQLPRAYELPYIASKAAMNAAIPCMAIELASLGIRVNGIMPGIVNTKMITAQQTEEQEAFNEKMINMTLLGAAEPDDIASVISFLLSDDSKMITGRVIPVDGGMFL